MTSWTKNACCFLLSVAESATPNQIESDSVEYASRNLVRILAGFRMCKSGCAYNGITDVLSSLFMKVQCDAVSENTNHNFCVSLRPWSRLGISYSLGKRDGICGMV